jgi:hypothetical protein
MQLFRNFSITTVFSMITAFAKFFGFVTFAYPAATFKNSIIGVVLFTVNLAASAGQAYVFSTQLVGILIKMPEASTLKVFFVSIFTATLCAAITKMIISIMNAIFSREIFGVIKGIEKFNEEMKRCGIYGNDLKDFFPIVASWMVKLIIIAVLFFDYKKVIPSLASLYIVITLYVAAEIYLTITYTIFKKIELYRKHLE